MNDLMRSSFVLFFISFSLISMGQHSETWMPVPRSWKPATEGYFEIKKDFEIGLSRNATTRLASYATWVLKRLDWQSGLMLDQERVTGDQNTSAELQIVVDRMGELKLGEDETYTLEVASDKITLKATTDIGAMRGLETFMQMVKVKDGGYVLSTGTVTDFPRFPWRGLMIDVSRHFQPMEVIKRNIDGLAMVKMNVLHLHLVDDHGFRVESKVFPELTEKASNGQYFTQEEIVEIVQYAGDKGIRVIPEFDVPGHASAFLTAFPKLGSAPGPYKLQNRSGIFDPTLDPTNEKTYEFLDALFEEMATLFPDDYFHIGGDENEGKHWNSNPVIQAFMKKNGFKDIHELQNYFVKRIQKKLIALDKKMIGWDEILNKDLPKSAAIQSWRGLEGLKTAAEAGHKTILSNGFYIDLMRRASDHYLVDPLPESLGLDEKAKQNVLGGEATMWSELVIPRTIDSRIWPRTAVIAERLWSGSDIRAINSMYERMEVISLNLERAGLTHMSSREALMRNLSSGQDIEPLKILANVAEPLEGYSRNPGGKYYVFHNPFNRFADVTLADAPDARSFSLLVSEYQLSEDSSAEEAIKSWLVKWKNNHAAVEALIAYNPSLEEVRGLSKNLASCASIGLDAFDKSELSTRDKADWYKEAVSVLEQAGEQGARTELQIIEPIRWLVKHLTNQVVSTKTDQAIRVDGDLSEWEGSEWNYFVPSRFRGWTDTSFYATKWDKKQLYLAFKVQNRHLQATATKRDQEGLWQDDGIEILIDCQQEDQPDWAQNDIAYHVNINNAVFDEKGINAANEYNKAWNGKAKSMVQIVGSCNDNSDIDEGYTVEFAISWKELGLNPTKDLKVGVNLCVNDSDPVSGEYRYYDLMGLKEFHRTKGFADLILE